MYLTFRCPQCDAVQRTEPLDLEAPITRCTECGWSHETPPDQVSEGSPRQCLTCGNGDLWRQKDFPQSWGIVFVALGAILSGIAWYYHRPILALTILMGFALLDMVLFSVMPDVLVCYRCQTKHHGAATVNHESFNHELAEKYRQEAIRLKNEGHASRG